MDQNLGMALFRSLSFTHFISRLSPRLPTPEALAAHLHGPRADAEAEALGAEMAAVAGWKKMQRQI